MTSCRYSKTNLINCYSNELAGVHCEGELRYHLTDTYNMLLICTGVCTNGEVGLRGSSNDLIGRVEVCVYGEWSTVCDRQWDDNDAAVICRQLGHSSYGTCMS